MHAILKGLAAAAFSLWAAAAAAQTAAVLPVATAPALATGEARPVAAWSDWCRRVPGDCAVNTAEPALITLTPQAWRLIQSVNRTVNRKIEPMTDMEQLGVVDSWDLPTSGYGDCEDYQLLKRRLLVEAGLPRRALRMTVVVDEKGEGHAVLMARTDRGDLILDNKIDAVLAWHQTGYVYVKREGHNGTAWVSLGGARSPVVTANR
ncbi:MAG TPA: transglutaminase-like cysteine peptidase [Salinarimonas sp.]|jgi:predicted transglutaminase-like cysteine proteinase|nr:transglutaminase-like cysteine peptidase [Salinarimonas sp.]